MAEDNKTYITEANTIAVLIIWLAKLCGVEMPGEVAVSVVAVLNIGIRVLSKKGLI